MFPLGRFSRATCSDILQQKQQTDSRAYPVKATGVWHVGTS
jgi:hypothetical protein